MTTQMKDTYLGRVCDLAEAVSSSVYPRAYACDGQIEEMRHEIDRLASIVGILAGVLDDRHMLDKDLRRALVDWTHEE